MNGFTYGAEHEWADWDMTTVLPPLYGRDKKDITIVNSNGIANDPSGKYYKFGGEINTPPTDDIAGQLSCLEELQKLLPDATINYRSNLHVHIRVPGLIDDLQMLKRIQRYIHGWMPIALLQIEPLPRPEKSSRRDQAAHEGALRRWRRRRVSHQTLLGKHRLAGQLEARTVPEFFEREVPFSRDGKPMWHFQPRLCVNLRQHRETNTIEFRHFPGTMDVDKLATCICWCRDFLTYAMEEKPIKGLLGAPAYASSCFPPFPEYDHDLEQRYRMTAHDGKLSKTEIAKNIERILAC